MGKNPLYVVTNNGQDVQAAAGLWDAIVKKLHLQPLIDMFEMLFELILNNLNSYAWFQIFKQVLDNWVKSLETITNLFYKSQA